ncbi:MAG: hypothetical protein HC895_26710 [Leptolyngbyaceae cyanobacterium SM1_3_5]|nr:hypothetical protein [Leptolyngbyaceae cyanobacterium SM1_3_5]
MIYSFLGITSCLLAILTLFAGFSQITALHLREEEQSLHWPHDDAPSGSSGGSRTSDSSGSGGSSTVRSNRSSYGGFSGGGPGGGK